MGLFKKKTLTIVRRTKYPCKLIGMFAKVHVLIQLNTKHLIIYNLTINYLGERYLPEEYKSVKLLK